MMLRQKTVILLTFIAISIKAPAQGPDGPRLPDGIPEHFITKKGPCKCFAFLLESGPSDKEKKTRETPVQKKKLRVSGNVSYDFFYRSQMDTPYKMRNLQEHNIRVNLHLLINEQSPYDVSFSSRIGNSTFFNNFFDVGFRFDPAVYRRRLIQSLADRYPSLPLSMKIDSLTRIWDSLVNLLSVRRLQFNAGITLQQLVEAKERLYGYRREQAGREQESLDNFRSVPGSASDLQKYLSDSLALLSLEEEWSKKSRDIEKLQDTVRQLRDQIQGLKTGLKQKSDEYRKELYAAGSVKELKQAGRYAGDSLMSDKKMWRMAAIKNFAVGRTYLDFSELTVKNVVLTGVQIEYNPGFYAAMAVGKPDYNFRDFISFRGKISGQKLGIVRFGWGDLKKRAVIISVFGGAKNYSSWTTPDSLQAIVPLLGVSLESVVNLNQYTFFKAEVARSTKPVHSVSKPDAGSLFDFNDAANTAWRIEGRTSLPATGTTLRGYYRRTGGQFQSFNYASFLSEQTAWLAQLDQFFCKRRLTLTGMLRKNDFLNPFAVQAVRSTAVFKSVALKMNIPRYPLLNIGFYPSTQYFISDNKELFQNIFYVFNSTLAYSFRVSGYQATTVASYSQYVNKAADAGFIDYKGTDYSIAGSIFMNRLTFEENILFHRHPDLSYFTNEIACEWSAGDVIAFGGSVQFNRVIENSNYTGYSLRLSVKSGPVGTLRLMYNKSYHPGEKKAMRMYDAGRISVLKNF